MGTTVSRALKVRIDAEADLYVTTDPGFEPPGRHASVTVYMCGHEGPYRRDDAEADVDLRMGPVVVDNGRDMAVAVRRRGLTAKTVFAKF